MINVMVHGACGHMGREVVKLVQEFEDMNLVACVDKNAQDSTLKIEGVDDTLYFDDIVLCGNEADVIIDFSHHSLTSGLLEFAVKHNIAVIVATTGHDDVELEIIKNASKSIPVFHSANMSLGVALLVNLAKQTAKAFPDSDIEIVETHHTRKLDAPSGTAIMLANALKVVRPEANLVFARSGADAKRDKDDITVLAVRRGNIVGIHEVYVSTQNQTILLKHEAHSRALFAEGSISAARFLEGKSAGLYDMNDIIEEN